MYNWVVDEFHAGAFLMCATTRSATDDGEADEEAERPALRSARMPETSAAAEPTSMAGGASPSSDADRGDANGLNRLQNALQTEREAAAASAAEAEHARAILAAARKEALELQEQTDATRAQMESARAQLAALEQTKADTQAEADGARRVLASARKETVMLQEQQVALQDELVGRSTRLQEAVMTAEVRAQDAEARAMELQAQVESLRREAPHQAGWGAGAASWFRKGNDAQGSQ